MRRYSGTRSSAASQLRSRYWINDQKTSEIQPLIVVAIVGTRRTITGPRVLGNYETSSELVRFST